MKATKRQSVRQMKAAWVSGQRKLAKETDREGKRIYVTALLPAYSRGIPQYVTFKREPKPKGHGSYVCMSMHSSPDRWFVSGGQALKWLGFSWRKLGL